MNLQVLIGWGHPPDESTPEAVATELVHDLHDLVENQLGLTASAASVDVSGPKVQDQGLQAVLTRPVPHAGLEELEQRVARAQALGGRTRGGQPRSNSRVTLVS
jgi:hypothetical protein